MTAQILSSHAAGSLSDFGKSQLDSSSIHTSHKLDAASSTSTSTIMDTSHGQRSSMSPQSAKDEVTRGRRRIRESSGEDNDDDNTGDGVGGPGSSRKRRRSRRGLDKKFECPHDGCGKSYSRAEHLYRHQLNHNPKQIYHCDFPDCQRSFVRQDLCARHKERHTARGSQLLRKEQFGNINPIVTNAFAGRNVPNMQRPGHVMASPQSATRPDHSPAMGLPVQSPVSDMKLDSVQPRTNDGFQRPSNYPQRQSSFGSSTGGHSQMSPPSTDTFSRSSTTPGNHQGNVSSPFGTNARPQNFNGPQMNSRYNSPQAATFQSQQNFPAFSALPPPGFSTINQNSTPKDMDYQSSMTTSMNSMDHTSTAADSRMNSVSEASLLESVAQPHSMPVFGMDGYTRSPFAMADDFTAWLFNESGPGQSSMPVGPGAQQSVGTNTMGLQGQFFNYTDPNVSAYYHQPVPPQHSMAVHSIIDASQPEIALSEEKRQRILDLIQMHFNETDHASVRKQKEELLEGMDSNEHHVLSLAMMQTYIHSYWIHFHPQMPILHRPTFNADNCPDLLIIAIIMLGASCLEKSHGYQTTQNCSDLSNFLAWHLRWEIFRDSDFGPPAKLWIFQTLLLLEIFEKMYSTRRLHERAHIHHATTLFLMRRGSSLIGRSALDSPPSVKDGRASRNGSVSAPSSGAPQTPDEWWNRWIQAEATRRCAFAAFIVDSLHATMFGHSAVMVAHEMRLPLPCDESLWAASSSGEVGRVESQLHAAGVKPTTFLDGLKKTLNGQTVKTNSFGRTIIMAGLLSVSWHMNQRDLQVSYLNIATQLGGRDRWRGALTRAFDFWRVDFDNQLANSPSRNSGHGHNNHFNHGMDDDNVWESRCVLHHVAHMAMHVDIVDCQIFAGAARLLGRSITPADSGSAQKRMRETWAPTARARDATFYALKFLRQVLIDGPRNRQAAGGEYMPYNARDDFLINRPWVLYFAALVVWSYGFALDGPLRPVYQLHGDDDNWKDMEGFLKRLTEINTPEELVNMKQRNACLGMCIVLREMFKKTRWELMHEASAAMGRCVDMLVGGQANPGQNWG